MRLTRRCSGALTNPAPGVLDFDAWRALQPIYDAAKQAGIFITLRPGMWLPPMIAFHR